MCGDSIIRGVLRQIISNKVVNYYSSKTKITMEAHLKIKQDKIHTSEDTLVEYKKERNF